MFMLKYRQDVTQISNTVNAKTHLIQSYVGLQQWLGFLFEFVCFILKTAGLFLMNQTMTCILLQ